MWWILAALFLLDQEDRVSRLESQARRARRKPRRPPRRLTKEEIRQEVELRRLTGQSWPFMDP